jgi:hypothetical protein
MDTPNRPERLIDCIDAISETILHGTPEQKKAFEMRRFFVADTPESLKPYGIIGDFFAVRYGVISRHFGKDPDHNLTAEHWKALTEEITRPFAISEYGNGFRLFTNVKIGDKWIIAGVDVKNMARNIEINNIATAFGYNFTEGRKEKIVSVSEKATPEQVAILGRLNSGQYLPTPVLLR